MAVCFSPTGRKLVSGGEDSMLWIWNMKAKRIEVNSLKSLTMPSSNLVTICIDFGMD